VLIVNCVLGGQGWSPIHHLVELSSKLLEADVSHAPSDMPSLPAKISSVLRRRNGKAQGRDACLLICAGPGDLVRVLSVEDWRSRFKFMAAWVIDSFWLQDIPKATRLSKPFDHFFVTCLEDVPEWEKMTGVPTTWLPWGTDALKLGTAAAEREWDIGRLGRQPPEWEEDASNATAARLLGMSYRGRVPEQGLTAKQNQELVMRLYGGTKFQLAFSNSVNPTSYTHRTRQYLTGRWVDALACGATVAGVSPRSPDVDELLWPGATLELGGVQRQEGLERIADALKAWTARNAACNNLMALRKLDWRWRLQKIADMFAVPAVPLRTELGQLAALIQEGQDAVSALDQRQN